MGDGPKLHGKSGLAALLVLCVVLWLSPASLADSTNVFAGTWSTVAGGLASGSLTLAVVSASDGASDLEGLGGQPCAQPTTYYYGNYSDPGNDGVIAGCTVSADQLVGAFRTDSPAAGESDLGTGELTYTAPNSFSGQLTYGGSSYSYTGTLNGSSSSPPPTGSPPPSIPPTTPPSGSTPSGSTPSGSTPSGSTPSGSTPSGSSGTSAPVTGSPLSKPSPLVALPGSGVVLAAEPAPGNSATVVSPDLLGTAATAIVGVADSEGNFAGTTIVGPGDLKSQSSGETVACWLIGPDAAGVPTGFYGQSIGLGFFRGRLHASDAYTSCVGVAQAVEAASVAQPTATAAAAQGGGCTAQPVEVAIDSTNGLITQAQPIRSPVLDPSGVRYGCDLAADGGLKISVSGGLAGGLRAALGEQLRLGVVRAPDATARQATVKFSFGASWTGSWHTTHGAMVLTQSGAQLTGTYAACGGKATIRGQVSGRTFAGTWTQHCDSSGGRLLFTLAVDGQSFKGHWGFGHGPVTLSWNATRS